MMTPQEVASHTFSKATLGGYNMAMVDSFLDTLTEDYTALYNDNAILKSKLKVLSDTVEEYRATDVAMRKTLLAAQQMAESMVNEAEKRKDVLVHDAETAAARRIGELREQIAAEEHRLKIAQAATADYVSKLRELHNSEIALLDGLSAITPPAANPEDNTADEIKATMADIVGRFEVISSHTASVEEEETPVEEDETEQEEEAAVPAAAVYEEQLDANATRRFENLQFSKDYEIE